MSQYARPVDLITANQLQVKYIHNMIIVSDLYLEPSPMEPIDLVPHIVSKSALVESCFLLN